MFSLCTLWKSFDVKICNDFSRFLRHIRHHKCGWCKDGFVPYVTYIEEHVINIDVQASEYSKWHHKRSSHARVMQFISNWCHKFSHLILEHKISLRFPFTCITSIYLALVKQALLTSLSSTTTFNSYINIAIILTKHTPA